MPGLVQPRKFTRIGLKQLIMLGLWKTWVREIAPSVQQALCSTTRWNFYNWLALFNGDQPKNCHLYRSLCIGWSTEETTDRHPFFFRSSTAPVMDFSGSAKRQTDWKFRFSFIVAWSRDWCVSCKNCPAPMWSGTSKPTRPGCSPF